MKEFPNSDVEFDLVKSNVINLNQIKNQSRSLCMAAVQINPKAILYMQVQYEDVCIHTVAQCGDLLKDVHQQTELIGTVANSDPSR